MKHTHLSLVLLSGLVFGFISCKKNTEDLPGSPTTEPAPTTSTTSDQVKDSSLAYARDLYLWYKQIPADFNTRTYADPNEIMKAIRPYSKNETGFENEAVDRWSFGIKKTEWDNISSGIAGDFGIGVTYRTREDLRVTYVEKASSAGKQGVHRGWRIVKINDNSDVSYSNVNYVSESIFNSNSTKFTFQKPDGATVDYTLNAASYLESPIFLDTTYNVSGKKIGYLVYNSFLGDTTKTYNEFNRIFNRFTSEGINDLVVDLRYNGGGYVTVQEKLANYLVPSAATGGVMMKQQFNDKYTEYNTTDYFKKLGGLNLSRIFFITGSGTASASELLINNLKPYMNVKTVGDTSYGKPVGYFNIPVGDWYVFPVSFKTVNKSGQGNYYKGFIPDGPSADGVDRDWGDLTETALSTAVNYIVGGTFRRATAAEAQDAKVKGANSVFVDRTLKLSVDPRKSFR